LPLASTAGEQRVATARAAIRRMLELTVNMFGRLRTV
jgi:hypothetical protein